MTQNIQWKKPVCQLDSDGLYLGQTEADLDINARDGSYIIPGGCIDTAPPEPRDGHAARWTGEAWEYIPDHRGKTAYQTADGQAVMVVTAGGLSDGLTFTAPPSHWHTWDGKQWALAEQDAAEWLAQAKAAKLAEINAAAQSYVCHLSKSNDVPEFERQTWPLQANEALAWEQDPSTDTPLLAQIAAARGCDLDGLRGKALAKAKQFAALSATVAGQRQAYADRLDAAQEVAAVAAIEPVYQLPQEAV
ncbi:TPA: tail fiber assembly protein [Neisseria weaveri]